MSLSRRQEQPARAVKYTEPRVSGGSPCIPVRECAAAWWPWRWRMVAGSPVASSNNHRYTSSSVRLAEVGGEDQVGQELGGGRSPDVAVLLIGDGHHEPAGEPGRVIQAQAPGEGVPPPGLGGVGDVLRVEHPHPPDCVSMFGGGQVEVGLVGAGHHRAGCVQDGRDGEGGGLARTRREDGEDDVLPGGLEQSAAG